MSLIMQQKYFQLKWQLFSQNVPLVFRENYIDHDVTLITDELTPIKAHKLVLAMGSPVFEEILKENPHEHPLIYLQGIKEQDVRSLMQILYQGKTNINNTQKRAFFKVLEEFALSDIMKLPRRVSTSLRIDEIGTIQTNLDLNLIKSYRLL